jgi:hypothetical protein
MSEKQCCGSGAGSGRICIIFWDPDQADPDRFQCQEYEKVSKPLFFPTKYHVLSNMTSLTLLRKIKHCKLAKLWLKVKKNRIFQHV